MTRAIELRLKEALQQPFENSQRFLNDIIFPVFGDENFESAGNLNVLRTRPELQTKAEASGITSIRKVGDLLIDGSELGIFDITLDYKKQLQRNRVEVQQIIRSIISTHSGAFIIFHYHSGARWEWRFSFCHKGASNAESTDAKRYTYLLGPGQSCRTAAENFMKLHDKIEREGEFEMDDIIRAFDVEALSKEFFEKYKAHYEKFCDYVYNNRNNEARFGSIFAQCEEKAIRDYVKNLLGRIVFLHFLQKKGWLGATDAEWTNGPQDFMHRLFVNATAEQKANFLDEVLEPLFSCLDTPLTKRKEEYDTKVEGFRSIRVPFMGGLFERNRDDEAESRFPAELFADLFQFLSEYNFTIDENDPNDAQVGVDPEMLGRIFENLLEDNKDKGAFYTPKEIVQYMCRESLIAYLQTDVKDEAMREALRQFVTTHDSAVLGGKDSSFAQNVSQCLKDVKICDPAIGSGAFPMGLLNELYRCRGEIEDFDNATEIKRHIIQRNIYGVDIEKGAVEIARLRFWLSLITDADKPDVLPNMDFKIMQGNSLLEQYKGFDLSHIMDTKQEIHGGHQYQMFEEQIDVIRAEVKQAIKDYYSEQDKDLRCTMRKGIQEKIQKQIELDQRNIDISGISNISATQEFFLWHTWFSDIFEQGGFDIVIGNPPYVRPHNLSSEYKNNLWHFFDTFEKKADLYVCFMHKGLDLLKKNGILSFIVSDGWLRLDSFEAIRKKILDESHVNQLIDFTDDVFASATVKTCILCIQKGDSSNNTINTAIVSNIQGLTSLNFKPIPQNVFKNNHKFVFDLSYDEQTACIKSKIEKDAIMLGRFFELSFGLKTGDDQLFLTFSNDNVLCKRLLRGADINRYSLSFKGEYVIYDTVAMRKHKSTARPGSKERFEQPKILIRDTGGGLMGTFDNDNYYVKDVIIISDKAKRESLLLTITGLLNSSSMKFYYETTFPTLHVQRDELAVLPIPKSLIDSGNSKISKLVSDILMMKKKNPQTSTVEEEREIDRLVYQLYGLTEEEIKIVEGQS